MHSANALRRCNDESETKPKSNKTWKWKDILKPIRNEQYLFLYTVNDITCSDYTIISPCDPITLVERLDILLVSRAAGNKGVKKELVAACDALPGQNLINKDNYKIIMLQLQNANNKKNLQNEICHWRRWCLPFHGKLFCENVFEQCCKTISISSSSGRKNCRKRY